MNGRRLPPPFGGPVAATPGMGSGKLVDVFLTAGE
jgi:hypothetical protein